MKPNRRSWYVDWTKWTELMQLWLLSESFFEFARITESFFYQQYCPLKVFLPAISCQESKSLGCVRAFRIWFSGARLLERTHGWMCLNWSVCLSIARSIEHWYIQKSVLVDSSHENPSFPNDVPMCNIKRIFIIGYEVSEQPLISEPWSSLRIWETDERNEAWLLFTV